MRAVLDVNVIISALLAPKATPARVLRLWLDGSFDLVASELLLAELERALAYPKLQGRIRPGETAELVGFIRRQAEMVEDSLAPPRIGSSDPGDDYLIGLAEFGRAALVSGDMHLLDLRGLIPVYSPSEFLALLAGLRRRDD